MKKTLWILNIGFLAMILCANAYAAIEPIITVNGMTGTVNVATGSPISVKLKLSPGDKSGTDADWWLVSHFSGKWYYYTLDGKWTDIGDSPNIGKLRPAYQGKLFDLSSTEIFSDSQLSAGNYDLYFGVDMNMNGTLDTDSLVFRAVSIRGSEAVSNSDFATPGSPTSIVYNYSELPWTAAAIGDHSDPKITQAINIKDFIPLSNGYGVQVTESNKRYVFRAVPLSDPNSNEALSEIIPDIASYSGSFVDGNLLYIVSNEYSYCCYGADVMCLHLPGKTKIRVIDFSIPANPANRGNIETDGNYQGSPKNYSCPNSYHRWGQVLRMNDNIFLIPYYAINNESKPDDSPPKWQNVIKVADFSDPDHPKLLSELVLGYAFIEHSFIKGNTLYFSYAREIGKDERNLPQSQHYLGRVYLSNISAPVELSSVSIPGVCIGTDKSGEYVFTFNYQKDWSVSFNSLNLDNDKAYLTGKVTLKDVSDTVAEDGFVYLGGYRVFTIIDANNPENPKVYEYPMKDMWITISGVKNRKIFVKISDGSTEKISLYDASDPANLRLIESVEHGGYDHVVYSGSNAYMPMGYYGVWVTDIGN